MADSRLGNDADILRVEPLRVVVLVDRTVSGGSEELLLELMRRMNPVRFTSALAICRGPVELDLIRDFQVSGGLLEQGRLRGLIRLTRLLRETADVLLVVGAGQSMFWGRLAGRFAKLSVIVSVLEARAVSVDRLPPIGWFNRLLYRWTDSFVVAGPQQSRSLMERERIPAERVRVIPPGVNVSRFDFEPAVPFAVRRELNLPEDVPLVGLANSGERKDTLSLFLQSSRSVLAARRDAHFVVFGEPHPLAEGNRQFSRAELDGRIHFVGKDLSIHRMVSALNVMCWMDGGEEMEIPILEAMSAQVPVVVARGDLVNDKRLSVPSMSLPGCHVVPRASTPIADALLRILGDPELARQMGRSGRNEATRHGSIDRMVSAYEQLILEIYYRKNRTPIPSVESGGGEMEVCTAT